MYFDFTERTQRLIGEANVAKLADASVLLFGLGGVGSYCAESLVRAGVGHCTIVDGDSGLLSPLAPSVQAVDMVRRLQLPILFVISPRENAINNTLTSIYTALEKGLEIRGVVLNNIMEDCSKQLLTATTRIIEEYTNVNILGLVPNIGSRIKPEDLITGILNGIDIESVFKMKIEKLELN